MVLRLMLLAVFVIFFAVALSIPVFFPSMTLWYKFGADRLFLQSAQYSGLIAFVLLYLQVILAARGQVLEKSFSPAKLMKWHQKNGIVILIFSVAHILLVLLPEGLDNLPLGLKFWPELIGLVLAFILFFMVITSRYRKLIPLSYPRWREIHRSLGYLVIFLVSGHLLFVSDTFENLIPRLVLLISFLAIIFWVVGVKWSAGIRKRG